MYEGRGSLTFNDVPGNLRGPSGKAQLSSLLIDLPGDAQQMEYHRSWVLTAAEDSLKRISNSYSRPDQWFPLASDLWHVGKIYAAAQDPEARGYFERALQIWLTCGAERPELEHTEAVSGLRENIGKLA